jgi:hypothetical protein
MIQNGKKAVIRRRVEGSGIGITVKLAANVPPSKNGPCDELILPVLFPISAP